VEIVVVMAAVKVEEEIAAYLPHLSPKQKQAVLGVVKTFAAEKQDWWDDKEYITEMNRRFDEMESGKVKGYTLDELESGARQTYKSRKRKKG
jgi:hypothetical protein